MDTLEEEIAKEVETFHSTVGEVEAEVLLNKVASSKAVVRVSTIADMLTKVWANAISDTLPQRLPKQDIKTS